MERLSDNNNLRREDKVVGEYKVYSREGRRIGRADAPVTIVEFGDYQCPACRSFEPILLAVAAEFSKDVAIVYRHWPLPQHAAAHLGARAAECAAEQGQFETFHKFLYDNSDWMVEGRSTFMIAAQRLGIPDQDRFETCINSLEPVATIIRDIAAAESLEGSGTPTILVNDLLLGRPPTADRLRELLRKAVGE